MVRAKAPRSYEWALGKGYTLLVPHAGFAVRRVGHLVRLMREQTEGWFARPWPDEIADALAATVRTLRPRYGGPDASGRGWAWGRIRRLTLVNPVGRRKPMDRIFNIGPIPWGGDANTVGQASVDPLDPTSNPIWIASMRAVMDVGEWENSRFVLPGGQSGNPLSPHYDDMLPLWRRGEGVPIAWSPEEIARATKTTLRLEPGTPMG
ncbi:MAG: penicillin acylase family protein, partial [Chloroflexi bacterium]|nr:penicillin acylase family protein [Chloroflexota bacterium]